MRFYRRGDPLKTITPPKGDVLAFLEYNVLRFTGDQCLKWPFARRGDGAGQIRIDGKARSVPRVVCERIYGPPPTSLHEAAHACGCGHLGCVNPRHLKWATRAENEADKVRHGTLRRGSSHVSSKLTDEDVLLIFQLSKSVSQGALAKRFGVKQSTISRALRGINWRHLHSER